MKATDIASHARALYNAHGDAAEAEATQRASAADTAGNAEEAEDWRAIRRAIAEIRGSHVS